uniref:Protein E6 n=1 Tax=Miniopterus schreibersii papillomavirus 1 TaxID=1195364 RepID=I3VR50_9PAPI|nr:E6 [Miniopterus schreibersii papillomavirus 1]
MEARTAAELCASLGIPPQDLLLPCTFCAAFLTAEDFFWLEFKQLFLVWRRGCAHGICKSCQDLVCTLERLQFGQRLITADDYCSEFGDSVYGVNVRCLYCLKLLCTPEIDSYIQRGFMFSILRGRLRAVCFACNT